MAARLRMRRARIGSASNREGSCRYDCQRALARRGGYEGYAIYVADDQGKEVDFRSADTSTEGGQAIGAELALKTAGEFREQSRRSILLVAARRCADELIFLGAGTCLSFICWTMGAIRFRERRQMLLYAQTWLPLVTITLSAAIFFAITSFMLARAKP
jgi:hypothetical protein